MIFINWFLNKDEDTEEDFNEWGDDFEDQLDEILINPDDYDLETDLDGWEIKCECGAEAAKAIGNHSSWCPKYNYKDSDG